MGKKEFCERRDLNPYAEALDPKSSVSANFTTLADYGKDRSLNFDFFYFVKPKYERPGARTPDPQIKSLLLYQLS